MNEKLPCGYDASKIDYIDCRGFEVCDFTKKSTNEKLAEVLKETMGIDINAIKNMFKE